MSTRVTAHCTSRVCACLLRLSYARMLWWGCRKKDGSVTSLGPGYAVGAETPGLPCGGNAYTVVGAFLTPLSKGTRVSRS